MASINKVILIGRIGRDPETTFSANGSSELTKFSMATSENYTSKSGEKQESTEWHNIVLWNKLSSLYKEILKKGFLVYVEGKLKTNKWTDNNNVTKYRTEIWANVVRVLQRPGGQGGGGGYQQNQNQGGGQGGFQPKKDFDPFGGDNAPTIDDDDIPF